MVRLYKLFPLTIAYLSSVRLPCIHHGRSMYCWRIDWVRKDTFYSFVGRWSRVRQFLIFSISFSKWLSFVSSVGLLFLWSADSIRKGTPNGLEGAFGMNNPLSQLWLFSLLCYSTRCFYPSPPLFTSSSNERSCPHHLGCDCSGHWYLLWKNNSCYQKPGSILSSTSTGHTYSAATMKSNVTISVRKNLTDWIAMRRPGTRYKRQQ